MDWKTIRSMAVLILLAGIAVGCTGMSAKQAAMTTSHVIALEQAFDKVEPIVEQSMGAVSEYDRGEVKKAWQTLVEIRDEVQDSNPANVLSNVEQSQYLYERARAAYTTLRPIAERLINTEAIPPTEAAILKQIDRRALALDEQVKGLKSHERSMAAIQLARDLMPLVRSVVVAL